MLAENATKNANYIKMVSVLKSLREDGIITRIEYQKAKKYYKKLTGADIIITD